MTRPLRRLAAALAALVTALVLTGCREDLPPNADPDQVDAVEAPDLGACRLLTIQDIAKPSNATRTPINTPARTRNDLFRARLAAPPT